jgi:hypothetical protein
MHDPAANQERWVRGDFVIGVIENQNDVASALADLIAAGFSDENVRVFSGEQGRDEFGRIGGEGLGGILLRAAEDYAGDAKEMTDHLKEELTHAHVLLIEVDGEEAAHRVRDLLEGHQAYDLNGRIGGSYQPLVR